MTLTDYSIVLAFLALSVGAGLYFSRASAASTKSYFLGDNDNAWWMLAASGSSSNFSLMGTIWMVSMVVVLGMKSFWTVLLWWMPLAVFLMTHTGAWIRRCGVMTSAELNRVRFGSGSGAKWARTTFAAMVTVFNIATIVMSYIAIHKFSGVFDVPQHLAATIVVVATGLYVLLGGFKGVVLVEFLQTILLIAISVIVGVVAYHSYAAADMHDGISAAFGTTEYWKSFEYEAQVRLGDFAGSGYANWSDFNSMVVLASVVGVIGCLGGAGGHYGEQRFLAARSSSDAAKVGALWQVLALPRWILIAALVALSFTVFRPQIAAARDPELVLPLFIKSAMLVPGIKGLVVAGIAASFMTTFSSVVNAAAAVIVRDIYQPLRGKGPEHGDHDPVFTSYVVTALLVASSVAGGYAYVEFSKASSALDSIWVWMMVGLVSCYVIPLALRWYWERMNGWGFVAGSLLGVIPSLLILVREFVGPDNVLHAVPSVYLSALTLALSLAGCILVSLLTPPLDEETIVTFYAKVRPFGFWSNAERRAKQAGLAMPDRIPGLLILTNLILGTLASFSLYMSPIYLFGHWRIETATCAAVFLLSCSALYFTWYRTLPQR